MGILCFSSSQCVDVCTYDFFYFYPLFESDGASNKRLKTGRSGHRLNLRYESRLASQAYARSPYVEYTESVRSLQPNKRSPYGNTRSPYGAMTGKARTPYGLKVSHHGLHGVRDEYTTESRGHPRTP